MSLRNTKPNRTKRQFRSGKNAMSIFQLHPFAPSPKDLRPAQFNPMSCIIIDFKGELPAITRRRKTKFKRTGSLNLNALLQKV